MGSVDVASVDIDEEMLKGHLMSPDFFDAENYPQMKFTSTALDVADDGTVRLSGELEIHGETREVQATGRFGTARRRPRRLRARRLLARDRGRPA